jgi:hypothetical protein
MNKNNEWLNDYEDFLSEASPPPEKLNQTVIGRMKALLNPNPLQVFSKLLGINIFVGFLSLAVCHQFGLNPFNTKFSLDQLFMSVGGHAACMVFCGVLFISVGVFAAGLFLSSEEIRSFRKHKFLQNLSLGVASISFLVLFGADIALGFGLLWMIGALMGGVGSTMVVSKLRKISI